MITFSKFGNYGNLGNQLHQLASLIGLSEKYNCDLQIPSWKYSKYFSNIPYEGNVTPSELIQEKAFHFTPNFWDSYQEKFRIETVDILGWLQSEKYWQHCQAKVLQAFTFKKDFAQKTLERVRKVFLKDVIAISIRRGDYVTNPNFHLLPISYYLKALDYFFPNFKDYNIFIFSDDISYCKTHIKPLKNIFFAEGFSDIEQLFLMSNCLHFIISNSTFSWWGARLGEKINSKVIRPTKHFAGELLIRFNTKDYYPDRWVAFNDSFNNISKLSNNKINQFLQIKKNQISKVVKRKLNWLLRL